MYIVSVSKHDEKADHLFKFLFFPPQLALLHCKTEILLYMVAFSY